MVTDALPPDLRWWFEHPATWPIVAAFIVALVVLYRMARREEKR